MDKIRRKIEQHGTIVIYVLSGLLVLSQVMLVAVALTR